MDSFVIFLIYFAIHVPIAILEEDSGKLTPPEIIISYDVDPYSPVAILKAKTKKLTFEVEYLTPYGKQVFKSVLTSKDFDEVYGAPCYVRARARTGQLVSRWSKPIFCRDVSPTRLDVSKY